MGDLDISEVARRSGVPASTLRFYEEKKLIASIGRRGLRRLFDPRVLEGSRRSRRGAPRAFRWTRSR
jgi:DNA-binding transcriptional MerR regulator